MVMLFIIQIFTQTCVKYIINNYLFRSLRLFSTMFRIIYSDCHLSLLTELSSGIVNNCAPYDIITCTVILLTLL